MTSPTNSNKVNTPGTPPPIPNYTITPISAIAVSDVMDDSFHPQNTDANSQVSSPIPLPPPVPPRDGVSMRRSTSVCASHPHRVNAKGDSPQNITPQYHQKHSSILSDATRDSLEAHTKMILSDSCNSLSSTTYTKFSQHKPEIEQNDNSTKNNTKAKTLSSDDKRNRRRSLPSCNAVLGACCTKSIYTCRSIFFWLFFAHCCRSHSTCSHFCHLAAFVCGTNRELVQHGARISSRIYLSARAHLHEAAANVFTWILVVHRHTNSYIWKHHRRTGEEVEISVECIFKVNVRMGLSRTLHLLHCSTGY
mmetsp:Transcript_10055/g.37495  ORF Transcript_10055/g.37495 Transcript_10055/m.37495 type:complete len:307 (+) Transcript_10055:475-1395(+)